MQNILTVKPKDQPFIRLSHYEGLDLSNSPDKPTVESITALRRRLHASQKLHVVLEAERARNEALLNKLKGVLGLNTEEVVKKEEEDDDDKKQDKLLGFLREKGTLEQGGTNKPITTTTEFTLSQLQSLRACSESLKNILPQLAGEPDPEEPDTSWRRERAEYIESASRKYLERSGGLELGPHGDIRDGEWQGGGRGLSKSEVEGLENVASMLGSTGPEKDDADDDVMDES